MLYLEYTKKILKLATPMIVGNLGIVFIGFGDVFVAARHSTDTLAAISIANSLLMTVFIFGISFLSAISPLLSNFRGEKKSIKKYFYPTLEFSMLLAIIICSLGIAMIPLVDILGFEQHLIPDIKKYMFVCSFSNFGVYLFVSLKEFLQAYEIVIFPNLLNIFCVFLNLYLNFVFAFGWYGLPAMGAAGLAWSTVIARIIVGMILFFYCISIMKLRFYRDYSYFLKIIKIGLPISGAVLVEMFAWNLITIFVARISGIYAAVQSILITFTNASFMVPMAISNAISVKVGYENGAKNYDELKKYSYSGIFLSVSFMILCAFIYLVFPTQCLSIISQDTEVLKIAVPILMLVAMFQVFDGAQTSIGGVFKGLKNTKIMMYGMIISYWIVGLPLGFLLAFKYNMKLYGFWIGITISIATLGIGLFITMKKVFDKLK